MRTLASRMPGVMMAVLTVGLIALSACGDDDGAGSPDTGTIKIVVEDWEGVEGYRLLLSSEFRRTLYVEGVVFVVVLAASASPVAAAT